MSSWVIGRLAAASDGQSSKASIGSNTQARNKVEPGSGDRTLGDSEHGQRQTMPVPGAVLNPADRQSQCQPKLNDHVAGATDPQPTGVEGSRLQPARRWDPLPTFTQETPMNAQTERSNPQASRTSRVLRTALVLGLGIALGGGLAMAGGHRGHHGGHGMMAFSEMDLNSDGMVSKVEAEAWRADQQLGLDADGDGAISFEEARAHRRAKAEQRARDRYMRQDSNGDGIVTLSEFNARSEARFARWDKNADGIVSADELPRRGEGRGRGNMEGRGK
jgi:hypothetical protein